MMKMQFFSTDYRYDLPESKPVWQAAEAFIRNIQELKKLHAAALTYMQLLMQASHKRDLTHSTKIGKSIYDSVH